MSFFPVGQSETRRPGENPPFTLDFQHLEEFRYCRIASCVSRLGAELVCCRPVIDCSAQHGRNIHSFSSDPYTHRHCTHTFLHTHTHAYSFYSVPLANADSGYMATKRTDKELTTPGRLARGERAASVDKIYSSPVVATLNSSCGRVFSL